MEKDKMNISKNELELTSELAYWKNQKNQQKYNKTIDFIEDKLRNKRKFFGIQCTDDECKYFCPFPKLCDSTWIKHSNSKDSDFTQKKIEMFKSILKKIKILQRWKNIKY